MNILQTQMAAMSAAMRILLAGHPLAKPDDLLIAASDEVTAPVIEMMMSHAANGRTTFLALFHIEGSWLDPRISKVARRTGQGAAGSASDTEKKEGESQ